MVCVCVYIYIDRFLNAETLFSRFIIRKYYKEGYSIEMLSMQVLNTLHIYTVDVVKTLFIYIYIYKRPSNEKRSCKG